MSSFTLFIVILLLSIQYQPAVSVSSYSLMDYYRLEWVFEAHKGEDGLVDVYELKNILVILDPDYYVTLSYEVLQDAIDRVDGVYGEHDGKLDFHEFIALVEWYTASDVGIQKAFDLFAAGNEYIDFDELVDLITALGIDVDPVDAAADLIEQYDMDEAGEPGYGQISYPEFRALWMYNDAMAGAMEEYILQWQGVTPDASTGGDTTGGDTTGGDTTGGDTTGGDTTGGDTTGGDTTGGDTTGGDTTGGDTTGGDTTGGDTTGGDTTGGGTTDPNDPPVPDPDAGTDPNGSPVPDPDALPPDTSYEWELEFNIIAQNDHYISAEDLTYVLSDLTDKEAAGIITQYGTNGHGIDYAGFVLLLSEHSEFIPLIEQKLNESAASGTSGGVATAEDTSVATAEDPAGGTPEELVVFTDFKDEHDYISIDGLIAVYDALGHELTDEKAAELIREYGSDEKLNYAEFVRLSRDKDLSESINQYSPGLNRPDGNTSGGAVDTSDATGSHGYALETVAQIVKAFKLFDATPADGRISPDELMYAMRDLDPTAEALHDMILAADANSDGSVDYLEFSTMMTEELGETETDKIKKIQDAFAVCDANEDTVCAFDELTQQLSAETITALGIREGDELGLLEFTTLMLENPYVLDGFHGDGSYHGSLEEYGEDTGSYHGSYEDEDEDEYVAGIEEKDVSTAADTMHTMGDYGASNNGDGMDDNTSTSTSNSTISSVWLIVGVITLLVLFGVGFVLFGYSRCQNKSKETKLSEIVIVEDDVKTEGAGTDEIELTEEQITY